MDLTREERGTSLDPAFSVEEHVSAFTGERRTRPRLPVVCLAVYQDGKLSAVPNRTDERTCMVPAALAIVEANEAAGMAALAGRTGPESSAPS